MSLTRHQVFLSKARRVGLSPYGAMRAAVKDELVRVSPSTVRIYNAAGKLIAYYDPTTGRRVPV